MAYKERLRQRHDEGSMTASVRGAVQYVIETGKPIA